MDSMLPDLMEQGTRYQHYMELIDIFNLGIEVLNNASTVQKSKTDDQTKTELEHAVKRIQSRMDVISKYSAKQYGLAAEINKLPKPPKEESPNAPTEARA